MHRTILGRQSVGIPQPLSTPRMFRPPCIDGIDNDIARTRDIGDISRLQNAAPWDENACSSPSEHFNDAASTTDSDVPGDEDYFATLSNTEPRINAPYRPNTCMPHHLNVNQKGYKM